jgi:hypothetical protein
MRRPRRNARRWQQSAGRPSGGHAAALRVGHHVAPGSCHALVERQDAPDDLRGKVLGNEGGAAEEGDELLASLSGGNSDRRRELLPKLLDPVGDLAQLFFQATNHITGNGTGWQSTCLYNTMNF